MPQSTSMGVRPSIFGDTIYGVEHPLRQHTNPKVQELNALHSLRTNPCTCPTPHETSGSGRLSSYCSPQWPST